MTTLLVLGGARSGKSAYAEHVLADRDTVTYVAPGALPASHDADWRARIDAHRARRPTSWATRESGDLSTLLDTAQTGESLLIDCLGTWLTRIADDASSWADTARTHDLWAAAGRSFVTSLRRTAADVVVVTNETGWGVVPASASGRAFRDGLGALNKVVADACDQVALVVAGRVLDLSVSPRLGDTERWSTPR